MTIRKVHDEINEVDVFFAEGEVAQISFKSIEPADKFGNTHRAGVRIGDDWVNNINIKVKEGNDPEIRFNAGTQGSPNWETLNVGDKVKIVVQPSEYNGKTYYNSGVSKIKLVKKGEAVATKQTASGGTVKEAYKPRDNTGVETGHAINGGLNLVRGQVFEDVVEAAKAVHTLTMDLKKEYAEKNPDMSDYDVGAMVGHAVLNATRDAESADDLLELSREVLDDVVPAVTEFVKESKKPSEPAKEEKKPAAKRGRKPVSAKKQEAVVEKEATDDDRFDGNPDSNDLDDDIPF